ncbi:branched-chain amino acid aminotransferase [Aequorivita sp. F47161]|uniref:Branched-chain-amino-acid aminotransferase n=1 Tax=Aequorivita vitellina TaxID=2874475 RepID=A0A9X1QWI0_9FLAO|nr:branched-chain amino acid aminotransferase [Aequorivita vitellina]MCG2420025.1 branched-chain amino acid aminotransferase [Aequorivita vitellina]MCZ4317962.1 branched-chain amino acid aminotransferase [Aequorivita viscosa]
MNSSSTQKLDIQKVATSRVGEVDFNNLTFGNTFTDHMFECDYKDGIWQNATIKPYGPLTISPAAKVFHYGQAVFEGMKAFKDDEKRVWLFRPVENFNRINKSSVRMAIPEFPKDIFFEALTTLVKMDKEWIQTGLGNSLYIRPFVIATQVGVSASPSTEYKFMILMSPAQAYYTGDVRVEIAEHYSRSANGGVGAAKAAGNYGAQFFPTNLAREKGFQQVIWTDANEHKLLEEAGTMNVFFRVNDTLITAPVSDRILDGVTRKSVLALAERDNLTIEVRPVLVAEIVEAAKNGSLKEIFGAGTAAVISPVSAFSYKGTVYELEKQQDGFASRFKKELMDIQYNRSEDPFGWRFEVA